MSYKKKIIELRYNVGFPEDSSSIEEIIDTKITYWKNKDIGAVLGVKETTVKNICS